MKQRPAVLLAVILRVAVSASGGPVLLVQGTTSIRDPAEAPYAARLAGRLEAWLKEFDVPVTRIEESRLTSVPIKQARTVILPYNPHPEKPVLRLLQEHVKRGGKLIVFYSSSGELARLMGLRLGEYAVSKSGPKWWTIQFRSTAPPFLPDAVHQNSTNVRTVYPAVASAEIIAFWHDRNGRRLPEPAWVRSPHGFWMTHVLRDDGSHWQKKQMLLALIGAGDPGIWRGAAEASLRSLDRLGSLGSLDQALAEIERAARERGGADAPPVELARARRLYADLRGKLATGEYGAVVVGSKRLRDLVMIAYGRVQAGKSGEFRGIWDHSGLGLYPGDWDRTCRILAFHGFTDVFPNLQWAGLAHYRSDVLPRSYVYKQHGDQARQLVRAARRHGLRVHVWKVCWKLGDVPEEVIHELAAAKRLQRDDTGRLLHWLCPSHPKNVARETEAIREVLARYKVDGIHLDYVRYPARNSCFCEGCRLRFESSIGRRLHEWPRDVQTGLLAARYGRWRRSMINRLVRKVRDVADDMKRPVQVSAAVYGKYPSCSRSVAQDWGAWLRNGTVDFVCPMNYTESLSDFRRLTRAQLLLPRARGRVYPGIGATASQNRLEAFDVIDQIRAARSAGASGFVLFQLNHAARTEILPVLGLGITRRSSEH